MKRAVSMTVATLAAVSQALAMDVYSIDTSHSEASFHVRHLVTQVAGRFTEFLGRVAIDPVKPESSSVEFTIRAASIDTGHADRNKHLRSAEFFDVEKHPEITFKSSRIKAAGKNRYHVVGTFTLHGVSKEITLPVTFLGFVKDPWGNEKAGFETRTTLNRKDYGMVWNQALDSGGVVLGNEVQVSINLEAVKEKPKTQ